MRNQQRWPRRLASQHHSVLATATPFIRKACTFPRGTLTGFRRPEKSASRPWPFKRTSTRLVRSVIGLLSADTATRDSTASMRFSQQRISRRPRSRIDVRRLPLPLLATVCVLAVTIVTSVGCQPPEAPAPARDPRVQKWLDRARSSYRVVDIDDAHDAVEEALRTAPQDEEVRLVAANIGLARLDFARAVRLTQDIDTSEAHAVRGRAFWYSGQVEEAAAELDRLLRDPDVRDSWAKSVLQLAHRGAGRKPYQVSGSIVAAVEMPRMRNGTTLVIPLEVDGEQGLGVLATGTAEVVLDGSQRREPSWVSLRIAGRVEFHDVPALTQDLSGIARQLGVPSIKALLGVNFLRHANATIDYLGQQFVVRRFDPPRPANATNVPLHYIRGGGMMLRGNLRSDGSSPAAFMVDSSLSFPIALDTEGWRKAGVSPSGLQPLPGETKLQQGTIPLVRLGAFDIKQVPGVAGVDVSSLEGTLGLDIDGIVGSGLLAGFRVTFGEGGRTMWVEDEMVGPGSPAEPLAAPASSEPPAASKLGPLPSAEPAQPLRAPSPGVRSQSRPRKNLP